jgi:putative IMPACT (imprinted ancient) family translation regulator
MKTVEFSYPFDLVQTVRNVLNKYHAKITEEKYDKKVEMKIAINSGYAEEFKKEVFENSKGQIKI